MSMFTRDRKLFLQIYRETGKMKKDKKFVLKLSYSAVCLALALILPFLTGNDFRLGNMLCLMHIPVLLCGVLCGWEYGAMVGLVAPLLRFVLFSRPPLLTAIPMAPELLVYGLVIGLLYKAMPKKLGYLFPTLIIAMICGRIAGGAAKIVLLGLGYLEGYSLSAWFSAYFTVAIPGIILQLVLIPIIVTALKKAKLVPNG